MATPFYKVEGVDILPYLADEGIEWEENDLDSEDSGRTLDGLMHRAVIDNKDKHTLTFRSLSVSESRVVTNIVKKPFVTVQTNIHPQVAGIAVFTMYNSSRQGGIFSLDEDGNAVWKIKPMSLIER